MHPSFSWLGSWITFQVTFTEFFIAGAVFSAVAYKHGWRSAFAGCLLGGLAIAVLALILGSSLSRVPFHVLDWISALLLLGFGSYLTYEFVDGLRKKADPLPELGNFGFRNRLNGAGVGIAAWAVIVEGLEVLIVWLAVTLKQGYATATVGVGIGLLVVLLIGLLFAKAGIFRKVPAPVLDGLAALFVTAYGITFLVEAIRA